MADKLKLSAFDGDDLQVISAAMQDALVAIKDIGWFAAEKRLVLVANRFRWEAPADAEGAWSRTHSALVFHEVAAVRHVDMPLGEPDRILELLSVAVEAADGDKTAVLLRFAAHRTIRVEAPKLLCHLEDLGDPWPTRWRPSHPGAEVDAAR
ncbi:MAG TPA: DUF2948 family protein [Vineibacter sp.]|nr:DUF2948 family protein [Vineibacter sp.]